MKVAVYDNPATFRREAWADGTMEGSASASLIESEGFNIQKLAGLLPWIIDDSPFQPGKIRGDREAIPKLLLIDQERDKECRDIVRRLAEWAESDLMGDFDQIASDAVVLWAKMKGGGE